MKKITLVLLCLFIWSCGNDSTVGGQDPMIENPGGTDTPQDTPTITPTDPVNTTLPFTAEELEPPAPELSFALGNAKAGTVASNFCDVQTQLQILSTSLISAYSSAGNKGDDYYCGGSAEFVDNGMTFSIELTDYCVNARDQQVTLNGIINGEVDSGVNFFSEIESLSIEGDAINLSLDGKTSYGRVDDMWMYLNISDLVNNIEIGLEKTNIKHNSKTQNGEFDLGFLVIPDVGKFYFKFIDHFNADFTKGMLFIYGEGEQLIIISADNGTITVVYKETKQDPGTLLTQTSCG